MLSAPVLTFAQDAEAGPVNNASTEKIRPSCMTYGTAAVPLRRVLGAVLRSISTLSSLDRFGYHSSPPSISRISGCTRIDRLRPRYTVGPNGISKWDSCRWPGQIQPGSQPSMRPFTLDPAQTMTTVDSRPRASHGRSFQILRDGSHWLVPISDDPTTPVGGPGGVGT